MKAWLPKSKFKQSVANKLILYILLFSSCITLIATIIQLYADYKKDMTTVENNIQQIGMSYLPSLVRSAWIANHSLLEVQLEGILHLPNIQYVKVELEEGDVLTAGEIKKSDTARLHQYPMHYNYNQEDINLGVLSVIVSLDEIYASLMDKAIIILITQAIKTFLVSIFIFFLFYWLIGRYLNIISNYAEQLDLVETTHALELGIEKQHNNELTKVVDAINKMRVGLQKAYSELDKKVIERTAELATANQEIVKLNKQLQKDNLRMGAELQITRRLQEMLLPKEVELAKIPDLDIAGYMQPADEVGGDYYDVLTHNGHTKIGIGDVTGHGLESGVLMLMVQTIVRSLLMNNVTDSKLFMSTLNQIVFSNIQRMGTDKNLSLTLLDYDNNGHVKICGQHEEVLVVRHDASLERIDTDSLGFIVGLEADISQFLSQLSIKLNPGDGIVLYTDGITEACNAKQELYGLERLCDVITDHWEHPVTTIRQAIIDDLNQYIDQEKVYDDITLLIFKRKIVA